MLSTKNKIGVSCPVIAAILFYMVCPKWSHGTFWNPLNITRDPLPYQDFTWWTDMYLSGNMTIIPVHPTHEIDDMTDIEMADYQTGWGDDSSNGLRMVKLSDRLYQELCPTWEEIVEEIGSMGETLLTDFKWKHGAHPIGCNNFEHVKQDISKEPLRPNQGIFFGRDADCPRWSDEIRDYIMRFSFALTTFFHDMDTWRLTSTSHSAPSPSVSIQCLGAKWWLFAPPRSMGKYGSKARDAGLGAVWSRGLDEDVEAYLVRTRPGSVLTFPQNWNHWVLSEPGKTYMYNIRWKPEKPIEKLKGLWTRIITERFSMFHLFLTAFKLFRTLVLRLNNFEYEPDIQGPLCKNELSEEYLEAIKSFNNDLYYGSS